MDILQDAYKVSNNSAKPDNVELLSSQQKSFESIVKAPYHSFYDHASRSVESPYTSLGSGRSSYASYKPGSYSSLRAKSLKANEQHESKSKAVMKALQNLQHKINALEVDRAKAESNLKTLATETSEYKEILKQKQDHSTSFRSPLSTKRESYSEELENQLESAQVRCETLEKQLEYMRKVMVDKHHPYPNSSPTITPRKHTQSTWSNNSTLNDIQQLRKDSPPPDAKTRTKTLKPVQESPALEKLNGLEKEHLKLSTSQSQAENKIRELEERIREESHCRKLLEDKANELEQVVAQSQSKNNTKRVTLDTKIQETKKRKLKKKVVAQKASTSSKSTTPRSPRQQTPTSPNHYLLNLANIPFVVGQSTTRSHSVGANVQNVLSIMKSHSKLCKSGEACRHSPPRRSLKNRLPRTKNDLQTLLDGLVEEFEQLGNDHRLTVEKLDRETSDALRNNNEKKLAKIIRKMESKGQQISTIREFLESSTNLPQRKSFHGSNNRVTLGSQEIEVVTTIRAPKNGRPSTASAVELRTNKNLELLKKAQKLQCQLQKNDLKWE